VDDSKLFEAPKFELPENHDHVVDKVVVINSLPGGFGQVSQELSEPIESLHFKPIKVKESMLAPSIPKTRMITAAEAAELMKTGRFHKAMVPDKPRHCRDCDGELPQERSLYCTECRPKMDEDPGQYRYCGVSGE
jgi:hypothetical protein